MKFIIFGLLGCGMALAQDIDLLYGTVRDGMVGFGIPEAVIGLRDLNGPKGSVETDGDGSYSDRVIIHEAYLENIGRGANIANELTYTTNAANYYEKKFTAKIGRVPSKFEQDIALEPKVYFNPANPPFTLAMMELALCKVTDNLFKNDANYGCIDRKQKVRWGYPFGAPVPFEAAQAYCGSVPGLRLPTSDELAKISNGNGLNSHLNFDATALYWSQTAVKGKNPERYINNLMNGRPQAVSVGAHHFVVCVVL